LVKGHAIKHLPQSQPDFFTSLFDAQQSLKQAVAAELCFCPLLPSTAHW